MFFTDKLKGSITFNRLVAKPVVGSHLVKKTFHKNVTTVFKMISSFVSLLSSSSQSTQKERCTIFFKKILFPEPSFSYFSLSSLPDHLFHCFLPFLQSIDHLLLSSERSFKDSNLIPFIKSAPLHSCKAMRFLFKGIIIFFKQILENFLHKQYLHL